MDYNVNGEWRLVFSDEFEGRVLDTSKWTAIVRGSSWNNEVQAYTPENVTVEDGILALTSRKQDWTGPSNLPYHPEYPRTVTKHYTSGLVNTSGKHFWTYGRFTIRAKACRTKGMLIAIWMIPESGQWPPEIDIAEVTGHETKTLYMTNHYGSQETHRYKQGTHTADADLADDFHIYAVEWEPGVLRWYLDNRLCFTSKTAVPAIPMHLILCPAVGPDWTGKPDDRSLFPQRFEIDWVRVYQKK
jgi:beta-glucanase (GH16 family)